MKRFDSEGSSRGGAGLRGMISIIRLPNEMAARSTPALASRGGDMVAYHRRGVRSAAIVSERDFVAWTTAIRRIKTVRSG